MKTQIWFCACALALFSLLPSAQASIATYSDLSAWQTDNPSSTVQDFNSIASGSYNPYSTPADGTIQASYTYSDTNSYYGNSSGGSNVGLSTQSSPSFGSGQYLANQVSDYNGSGYYGGYSYYDYYLVCNSFSGCYWANNNQTYPAYSYNDTQTAAITLTPPSGTTALGFEVGQSYNYSTSSSRSITATVTTADNETQSLTVSNTYGTLSFFGFDASDPITSVVITEAVNPGIFSSSAGFTTGVNYYNDGNGPNTGYYYYVYNSQYSYTDESQLAFDNLMYASNIGDASAVPEPTSVLLLGTVVLGAGMAARRKRSRRP